MPKVGQRFASDPMPMTSSILVSRFRKRRREILEILPKEIREEYRRLRIAIRAIKAEEKRKPKLAPARIPLSIHKLHLIEFLKQHGPTTRSEIIVATCIPIGSISEILDSEEFEQLQHGLWQLKTKKPLAESGEKPRRRIVGINAREEPQEENPGTSAPPAK